MYIKYCGKCGSKQEYKSKSNYKRAVSKDTLCRSCSNKDVSSDTKLKISNALKGKSKSKEAVSKMRESLIKHWESKSDSEMDDWRATVSKTSSKRWNSDAYRNRVATSVKNHWDSLSESERSARYLKQQANGAGVCKYIDVGGYSVYGMTEYRYILYIINNNKPLPHKNSRDGVSTPFGITFPDFEYSTHYIEVKSTYTYNMFIEGKLDANSQYNKQLWVNSNIKPVKVVVEYSKGMFKEMDCW